MALEEGHRLSYEHIYDLISQSEGEEHSVINHRQPKLREKVLQEQESLGGVVEKRVVGVRGTRRQVEKAVAYIQQKS